MIPNPFKDKAGLLKDKMAEVKKTNLPKNPFPIKNGPEDTQNLSQPKNILQKYGIPVLQAGLVLAFVFYFKPSFQSIKPDSSAAFEDVLAAIEEKADAELFPAQDEQALRRYFDLDASDYENIVFLRQDDALSASEIVLVRFSNNDEADQFQETMQERINSQIQVYEGYAPEQAGLAKAAQIEVNGNYAFYVCADNASELLQSFDAAVEKGR
jgi:hypothetical protein